MNKGLFPFEGTEDIETAIDRRMSGERLPSTKNASADFSRIILKACAFTPEDRYFNMSEKYMKTTMIYLMSYTTVNMIIIQ